MSVPFTYTHMFVNPETKKVVRKDFPVTGDNYWGLLEGFLRQCPMIQPIVLSEFIVRSSESCPDGATFYSMTSATRFVETAIRRTYPRCQFFEDMGFTAQVVAHYTAAFDECEQKLVEKFGHGMINFTGNR